MDGRGVSVAYADLSLMPFHRFYPPIPGIRNKCTGAQCRISVQWGNNLQLPGLGHMACPPRDATCRGFFGQFLLQQSAYADLRNNECPAWHRSLQRLNENMTEGQAPRSGPPIVVLVLLNYRFTLTSVWLRRH